MLQVQCRTKAFWENKMAGTITCNGQWKPCFPAHSQDAAAPGALWKKSMVAFRNNQGEDQQCGHFVWMRQSKFFFAASMCSCKGGPLIVTLTLFKRTALTNNGAWVMNHLPFHSN